MQHDARNLSLQKDFNRASSFELRYSALLRLELEVLATVNPGDIVSEISMNLGHSKSYLLVLSATTAIDTSLVDRCCLTKIT